jgi:hypothetical protein
MEEYEEYECLEDFLQAVREGKAKEPYYEDGDYYCPICGEPWDAHGVWLALKGKPSDMTKEEAEKFMNGEGCPCCKGERKKNWCKHWGENIFPYMDDGCHIGHSWCNPETCDDYEPC